jgi:hypothetical protein
MLMRGHEELLPVLAPAAASLVPLAALVMFVLLLLIAPQTPLYWTSAPAVEAA